MSVAWILFVAATGVLPADSSQTAATSAATTVVPANRSARDPRKVVADTLHRANVAKGAERVSAVAALVELFNELGKDRQLPPPERQRLGAEIRSRLLRFAAQFQHEFSRAAQRSAADPDGIASVDAALDDLKNLVDVMRRNVGPEDWVLAQRIAAPGGAGQVGAGVGAQAGGGSAGRSALDQQAEANGQALVELIQDTIAPDSWDIRGGPGSIVYFNPLRCLVVRQTGEGHDALGDLLGGVRK